jgi:hypothetical protein
MANANGTHAVVDSRRRRPCPYDRPLDVRISFSLHKRMMERELAPIPGAVVVEEYKPLLRAPLLSQPLATKIFQ